MTLTSISADLYRKVPRFVLAFQSPSFAYLKNLPVDFLKIDGLFVKDIINDPVDFAMVKSINDMGHVLGKQTIAEFVENDDILKKLQEIGVDYAQGYGVGKPRPLAERAVPARTHVQLVKAARKSLSPATHRNRSGRHCGGLA